ncbi:MAG TPA: HlyD family secretion protein [Arenimonas sp.]|uniref:HlyD family secretion protein n=1 Tax=Arenimonas sp. TaxID=1872635 RepID=UPI002D7EFE99|nr:HlyD family secretion protein [Arenimonas sp.]HEU0152537.1 HlyD family secretion protein [Arenimonas sp.]
MTSKSPQERLSTEATTPPTKRRIPTWLWVAGPLVVLAFFAWEWTVSSRAVATDNAYVKAERIMVSPQVGGRVVEVAVAQNQAVSRGQLLFRLDPEPLQIALDEATARLAQVSDSAGASRAGVREAGSGLRSSEENLRWAQQEYTRVAGLAAQGLLARKALDDARHAVTEARAARDAAAAGVDRVRQQLGGDASAPTDELPEYRVALAAVAKARMDLAHAEVRAPVAGVVGNHDLQAGEYLAIGQSAMPLVASEGLWVEANFKETDLTRLQVGQPASVEVDAYPGRRWPARVVSISPASGSEFSVLPPQNATGNWVKVVQRIPVRLELDAADADAPVLRAGMSAEVEVDLTGEHDLPARTAAR